MKKILIFLFPILGMHKEDFKLVASILSMTLIRLILLFIFCYGVVCLIHAFVLMTAQIITEL
jgi:hypothetical protein